MLSRGFKEEGGAVMVAKKGRLRGFATLSSIGIHLVACTVIGLLMGIYLDRWLETEPWLTIALFLVGVGAGFKNLFTATKRYGFSDDEEKKP